MSKVLNFPFQVHVEYSPDAHLFILKGQLAADLDNLTIAAGRAGTTARQIEELEKQINERKRHIRA